MTDPMIDVEYAMSYLESNDPLNWAPIIDDQASALADMKARLDAIESKVKNGRASDDVNS